MKRGTGFRIGLAAFAVALLVGVWRFGPAAAFHLLPPGWTGEADRLAAVLSIQPGMTVADIGAGSGRLAFELARRIGPEGQVFATGWTRASGRPSRVARANWACARSRPV